MSEFVKSILNYYAAFTETRFSNKSTLNYKWLDDQQFPEPPPGSTLVDVTWSDSGEKSVFGWK